MMIRMLSTLLMLLLATAAAAQSVQSVVYVELAPGTKPQALTAFADYAATARTQPGCENVELFEQRGRPDHYVLIETWKQQADFDAQTVEQSKLATRLQKLRVSNIDRRPYKSLDTAPAKSATAGAVYVISHIDAAPAPTVPDILQRWVTASRAEAGNLRFDIVQHQQRVNHYTVVEAWRDEAALQEHVEAIPTRRFRDEFGPFAGSPLDERLYDSIPL